jgi:hypothetical protein
MVQKESTTVKIVSDHGDIAFRSINEHLERQNRELGADSYNR